VAALC
jgi:hypothetical protein